MLKIKELHGFTLSYDERRRKFVITDSEGTEVGSAENQNDAEAKAKSLSKSAFERIKIFRVDDSGHIVMGELTSLNRDESSAWVSMEKSQSDWGSSRTKISLHYKNNYYEATEPNLKVLETIRQKREIIDERLNEIKKLVAGLEQSINAEYFGISKN